MTHRTSSGHHDDRHSDSMSSVPIVNSSTLSLPDTEIHHSPPSPSRTPDRTRVRTPQTRHNENNMDQDVEPTTLPSRDTDDVVPPQTIDGRGPDGSPQEEPEGNSDSRAQNLQSDASQTFPRIPACPGFQHHSGHPNLSNGDPSSSGDSSRANTEGHPDDSNDPSRVNRNHPSNGPVRPMCHFHSFPPFPYPGNAPPPPPPPPPPAPFIVPMVPPPIHYHTVPPLAPPTPWLPLWPTPVVPSVLLRPAVHLPPSAIVWEPGICSMSRPVPLHVHPHIMYNPINPSAPVLQWDVVLRPEQARVSTGKGLIKRPALGDEAVIPISVQELGRTTAVNGQENEKIDKIWIESETPALAWWMQRWGPIIIEKTNITVCDVMDAIHEYLSVPLTNEEYLKVIEVRTPTDGIRHTNGMRLRNARRLRASNGCELRSVALRARALTGAGEFLMYRRSDLLGAHRRFMGLRPVAFADGTWKLLLGLGSGPVPKYF
ncbi:hypothetical protein F5050DRAFT_1709228 [Lentinula boryana]|uniref:DUF6699 domain-containing protein n=1 Tax=Lentinula boryana TaxID=40481 RepID=A0ABQ8QNT6_9AGAR|nr:hypothetical protein F5050DRAFT_1709228 [Lentinula boryana]